MKKQTRILITFIALLAAAAVLLIVIGMRIGQIAAARETEHALPVAAAAAQPAQTTTPTRPIDEVDPTPPAPKSTPEPTPEPEQETEPSEEPEAVVLSVEDQPLIAQPEQGRYGSLLLTADELETIARVVLLEAGGECFTGQQAVAEVILNRVLSPRFPGNVYDVVYEKDQFDVSGQIAYYAPTQTQYDAVSAALSGQNVLPQQVLFFSTPETNWNSNIWGYIGGHVFCY